MILETCEDTDNVSALSGVELAYESESWFLESGGVELGLGSTVFCVHGF
jgi:hypothetical protein